MQNNSGHGSSQWRTSAWTPCDGDRIVPTVVGSARTRMRRQHRKHTLCILRAQWRPPLGRHPQNVRQYCVPSSLAVQDDPHADVQIMLEDIIHKLSGLLVNKDKAARAIEGLTTEAKVAQQEFKTALVLDSTAECQQQRTNIACPEETSSPPCGRHED